MTIQKKIKNLKWWNEIVNLKDILLNFLSNSESIELRVEALEQIQNDNVTEAPNDGELYGRKDTEWTIILSDNFNEAGQVKINYTGLTTTAFTANTTKTLNISAATPSIETSPTTTYPNSTPNNYTGVFDISRGSTPTGRLIENPIEGQLHLWRVQLSYSNKAIGNNGSLDIVLTNPISGFQYVMPFTLPTGRTAGILNLNAITIADQLSIPSPQGYILQAQTSFTDANLTVEITSITRISQAIETKI